MKWCAIFLCLCFGAVYGNPNALKNPYICGSPSCIPSDKFNYSLQIIYTYEYKVSVNTWFAGSTNNQSTLDVKSIASVQFFTPCEGLLHLSDVSLKDLDENYPVERAEKFTQVLTQHPLRFAFHDGIISEICPETIEEDWVINFKRGILSLFQSTMKRFDINFKGIERDIHGTCNVDYTVRGQEGTSLVVIKRRDLTQCTDRYKYMSILQTVRYNFQSKFQTWPVLSSESKCRIEVDHKVYKTVNCRERHLFEPFSGKQSGAMTTVIQDLVLIEEINKSDSQIVDEQPRSWNEISLRSNLMHYHTQTYQTSTGELKSARDVLKLLCEIRDPDDDSGPASTVDENLDSGSTVGLWGSLVRASRGLDHATLSQLLARAPSICPRATKHILDALPYIASVGSVELIKDMIVKGVEEDTKNEWLMSMAMIPRPKLPMLKTMLELAQNNVNDKVITFTASSMVHSYCKHSGKSLRECCEESAPLVIMQIFERVVVDMKQKGLSDITKEERSQVLLAIKALGNIGGFKQEFADILMDIIGDTTTLLPIRLAAIDAFRRTPCVETREYFLEMYREDFVDIEVRLASYLQVMRCPNLSTIRKIFHALRHETVNQAATFVWSHLNNLGQSSLPSRVEIQGLLSGNTVPQLEDNPDFRIFSRNYEQSVFFDQYNAGGNYEANVIFTPDSYLPRSVSLNLTVDMFGESINVLELKARGEGFEKYFEQVFGSYGALSKNRLNEYIQNLPRLFTRSLNNADEVREKIDHMNYKNEALNHQYPMAEIGLKVFGNEISYWSAEGDDEIRASLSKLNPQMRILEILSGKEISYNKASLFLDTTYSVPTGCGLPLTMNLMGTSYVNMKMSGTVVDRFSTSGNLDFEGKVHPSVALNVAATMGVIAGTLSSTGIRVNMRLYTATAVEAKLKLQGIKLIHLDLSLPHPKQEIFGAKSELIILHGDKEHQQMGLNQNRIERNTCSWSTFDKAIGIKICAAYQFPNMENLKNAPYFLMSGPSKYLISLEKADPSAKTYSFHYTWDENDTASRFSFSFDTPNSKEKRIFNSEMTLSENSSTALMSFQSAQSTLKAHGMYKNLEFDKSLEVSLDIDGRKHFDTVMSLKRHDVKFGFVWIPHAYLVVNDDRIAELSGSLKAKTKGGVTQWDVEAEFQTKQLASRLIGYYTINGPSYMTKLQLDYKFYNNTKQIIKFEGLFSERSAGYRHDLYAEVGMQFTAYPMYNFYSVLRNVKSASHLDIAVNISESNALRDEPKLAFSFVRMDGLSNMKLRTQLVLTKPKPIKMLLKYRQMGNKYNALALLNINPKSRDIIIAGFLHKPSGTQLFIDGSLNMTLPTLQPMYVNVKVHEKKPKEYQISTVGVWFTGVDFNIDALYLDQSKTNLASHRLKITINSSHFKYIAADARFTQDNRQITFVGDGEYNEDKYRALVRYVLISEANFTTHAEVDVNGKAYTVQLRADLNNNTNINMDIHVDQIRDLHISYQRSVSATQKRLSAAVNWDANRDPSQRVSVDVRLDHKGPLHHAGYLTLYYPGRPINGEFEVLLKDWFCQWHVRMGWSAEDVILWRVKMYSEAHNETVYALLSSMDTPFPGWTDTSFNLMWRYHDNFEALNGSMNWQKDYLSFSLLADYLFRTNEFYGEIHAEVNSTIPTLPRAAAIAKHRLVWKKSADTLLSFQYNDDGILMINSSWLLDRGQHNNNVTGLVTLLTPFPGYRKGLLKTKFVFGNKRDIKGDTFVDLEERSLKISVNGHMRRITNSLLAINVTHPITDYSHMTARFGFIEADKHLVAIVKTPNSTTGIEFLLQLNTIQDFNIFGHVALPIQYLTRAMITAKRAKEEVDFRVGWDKMNFGFTGIWHYQSPTNFIYLYKLYTPLDGFEENGIVLKNIYGHGLDTELSVRLSKHKFGIAILLVDHGKGVLTAITEAMQRERIDTDMIVDNFDTTAHVTLDLLYYPTIAFDSHLIKIIGPGEEDILNANATLHLPDKPPIVLTDVFILEELTVMRNTLHLVTPFQSMQELKSMYTLEIILGEKINITFLALLHNGEDWNEISSKVYYEYETGEDDAYQSYLASIDIVTPLVVLPALDGTVSVRLEDSLWKMSADIGMPSFTINATGRLELDDPFVETSGTLNLTSTNLIDYFIKIEFKKDFSDIENTVGGGIQVLQGEQNNYVFADVKWRPLPSQYIRFKAKAALSPVLPDSLINIFYTNNRNDSYKSLATEFKFGEKIFYSLNADQRPMTASIALSSPHKGFNNVKIQLDFEGDDITGSLFTDKLECDIVGQVLNRNPLDISLQITPKGDAEQIKIRLKSESTPTTYALSAHLVGGIQVTMHAKADFNANFTDINFRIDSPVLNKKDIYFKTRIDNHPELRRVMKVQAGTPFKELQYIKGDADFIFGPKTGYLIGEYDMPNLKGDGDLKWSFEVGDLFIRALGHQTAEGNPRSVDLDIYFGNTTDAEGLNTTNAGFRMDLDKIWLIGANASIGYLVDRRVALVINALLPKPNVDVHTLRIDGDIGSLDTPYKSFLACYSTDVTNIVTGMDGKIILLPTEFQGNVSLTWTANSTVKNVDNIFYTTWNENGSHFIDYSLISPLYKEEETFKVRGSYDKDNLNNLVLVKGNMHRPGSSQIGELDIKYGGTANTKGHFNLTTPFKNLLWLKSNFDIANGDEYSENKINIYWPNKTASVNTTHQYKKIEDAFSQIGEISIEIPLNTKHFVTTNYHYLQSDKWSRGNTTIDLDRERFCKGSFVQVLSESERNLQLATTTIEVENAHTPVGIKYFHEYDGSGNIDVKQATIFHLLNASSFNVTGKVDAHSWETGKTLKITAIHGERTLLFENDYEAKDKEMKQGSKVKWADDVWVNYDVHITNLTTGETESQQIVVNVWYPRRTFNLDATYDLQDTMLDGQARLNWNVQEQNKTAELKGHWDNPPTADGNVHNVGLWLSHPSFHKDVTLQGQYKSTPSVMSNISLNLQYSDHEAEHLQFHSILTDNSNGPIRDYKFALTCSHPATNLNLEMLSEINIHSHWYYLNNYYKFKKILFYEKLRHTKIVVDTNRSIIRYERANETDFLKINSTWDLSYPEYKIYTLVDRNTGNDTGLAILSMKNKSLVAHFNSTDDISYHMVGMIVDTRSAKLNAWRDYDDVTTVDLASYIRLNHSRLLTSSIVWRPEIFVEVKSQAVGTLKQIYSQINESLVILKQAPMEAHLALKNIWADAKPKMRDFLEDLNDLHVIKDDLDEFQIFLNSSYENNDFYVKDIVEFVYNVLDEMAIKNQLESLPGILNDVWGLMGNTGQSLKESLTFVITKVKQAYANFLESINKVLEADLMELLSAKLEEIILKYDNFVKDLHAKFLQYWETTWVNAINRLNKYWHEILKSIEPMIYKILHFFETISYNAWKNLMDFFYNRTQEITDSKYFNYVAAFGQELDHLYKDLVKNDLVTNIKKYTKKLWNNIWAKIEKYIPFQEEISSLHTEFKNAWENFLKTPQVTFFTDKYKEARDRLKWWYNYFYIGEAIDKVTEILYEKLTQIAKTALIYEEEHRTPKTNFVFDPRKGEILLEQKLPMSWHAFNRTPDFSEIPEYKAVRQVLDDWMTTNKSLWHYINEFRPYLDMNNVLPPFGGMAMLTGQGTIVTFDKRVFTISQTGTFLLTKDYKDNNFTVLMESNEQGRYNLMTLTRNNVIRIDLYRQEVSIGKAAALTLPAVVDESLIDRDLDTVTVQGQSGMEIQCNFLFKTCKIQISGWYYASVGGLFGTFNNEQYDDMQLTNNTYTTKVTELGHSWNLEAGTLGLTVVENHEAKNDVQCEKFFKNKVSPLHRCFSVIDVTPFYKECIAGVEACALANTYLEMCSQEHIPINIPEQCVQCTSPQGDVIDEGSFYLMQDAPNTTDIVFLVEAQFCNKDIRKTKNLDIFIEAFDSRLQGSGLSDNRYAVVAFGGSGIYKKPRSLYVNNKVFTNAVTVSNHFDKLVIEKRDLVRRNNTRHVDVFEALSFASTLPFRAAVSRTFILMPCTNCDADHMRLDYPTIHQNLMDNSITLHILMNDNLILSKTRASKYLFGIDNAVAYTNKDYENLVGDTALRKQVKLPKEHLGLCSSLAMETNGTIFSGIKLSEAKSLARRLSTVFGARAAQSARACNEAAQCECREARLDCRPCSDRQRLLSELSTFWSDDIDDFDIPLIDPNIMLGN